MILTLLFNGNVYANKISLIDIKIGDKMNDHFSNKQISKYYVQNPGGTPRGERIMGKDLKYSFIALESKEGVFNKDYDLIQPSQNLQKKSVNKAIKLVKMGNVKAAAKAIQPAINELIKMRCKKIILGCTELPIAIFAYKSFNNVRSSKIFLDPNLILANSAMAKHKR